MNNTKFITNQDDNTLKKRLDILLAKDTKELSVLVGYFYISGFFQIADKLENVKEIRILIGLSADKYIYEILSNKNRTSIDRAILSTVQKKKALITQIIDEISKSDDKKEIENGILKFIEWASGDEPKLKVKYYDKSQLHAKMYVMTFDENDRNKGHVITGSSNLSKSGLEDNLELNVELRDDADHDFALAKFNELWDDSIDINEIIIETVNKKTHLNSGFSPYDLYLKFLYEYFRRDLELEDKLSDEYLPENYLDLQYQRQAVLTAQKILEDYNGVFISDVVGLGKTYISARLAAQLPGKKLVLASPKLLDSRNPGSWRNAFRDFGVRGADYNSIGKIDKIKDSNIYDYVFIDESHNFRNDSTQTYASLHSICLGKKIILVSATPYNNRPDDLLAQIGLFQQIENSNIPGIKNLKAYFNQISSKTRALDRGMHKQAYIESVKDASEKIRENVLRHIMVRRTRREIEKFFGKDLVAQNLKFPNVKDPNAIYYELDDHQDKIFNETLMLLQSFQYAFYKPLLYKLDSSDRDKQSQENSAGFIKAYMIKRFESSVFAFRNSILRFIQRHEKAIEHWENGEVWITRLTDKINKFIDDDNQEKIFEMLESDKAEVVKTSKFDSSYINALKNDLDTLRKISALWDEIENDPKLDAFISNLQNNIIPTEKNKIIIFSESKETAEYLSYELNKQFPTLLYTGNSKESDLDTVLENFDARSKNKSNEYHILVATDVLSEGINLHRSNTVINYDLPWNPTKMVQRVGRVDRVDTKHDNLYIYNIFPTVQSNNQIRLQEAAEAKITAYIHLLGNDAKLLTDDETIQSNELFNKIQSKTTITGEEYESKSELEYFEIIKNLRDKDENEFARIRDLPLKLRIARKSKDANTENQMIVYYKRGNENIFTIVGTKEKRRIGFFEIVNIIEANKSEKSLVLDDAFYNLLDKSKEFVRTLELENNELMNTDTNTRQTISRKIIKRIRGVNSINKLTTEQREELTSITNSLLRGSIPRDYQRNAWLNIGNHIDAVEILSGLKKAIPPSYYDKRTDKSNNTDSNRIILLSEYFKNK